MTYLSRKEERRRFFYLCRYLMKQRPCRACSGSGHYDHNGSPPCGACDGTGLEPHRSPEDEVRARRMTTPTKGKENV